MSACADAHYEYQVGGSLRLDSPTYIYRQADRDLFEALAAGEYCYLFNSRQMGKSSLRVRTQQRLRAAGKRCTSIDMTSIGSEQVTPLQWYKGLMVDLLSKFDLHGRVDFKQWWATHQELSMVQRLRLFIEEILLVALPDADLLIFVDEIDSALALNFPIDDFFALVRYCYDQRAENPAYRRLTWALFGVVTPSDLIRDRNRTPFNIGQAIEIKGFQFSEAKALSPGLTGYGYDAIALIQEILHWTNGQPFLTQKLCHLTARQLAGELSSAKALIFDETPTNLIERLVYAHIIEHWESQDNPEHLRTIRDRLLRNERMAPRLLGIYEMILSASLPQCSLSALQPESSTPLKPQPVNDLDHLLAYDDSPEHMELLLSGLVKKEKGRLQVKNLIYQTIFDISWVKQQLSDLRPYARQLAAWVNSEFTDESRLLRGKALKDAQAWSIERSVSELDHDYLMASEQFDRKIAQQALKSARLKETEKRLNLERKARRQQRSLIGMLTVALVGAIALGSYARLQYLNAKQTELESIITTSKALYSSDQRIDALVSAIKANRYFYRQESIFPSDAKIQMNSVLRQAAIGVVEKNRLNLPKSNAWDLDISQDGNLIVTGSANGKVQLWKRDGSLLNTIQSHQARVTTVSFSPNGEQIVSGGDLDQLMIHNLQGDTLHTLTGHQDTINDIAIDKAGMFLVSAGGDGTVKQWSLNGQLIRTFTAHNQGVLAVALSPDGKTMVSAGEDSTVKIWSLDGKLIHTLTFHTQPVTALAFSPNGKLLAAGSRDKTISYWQVNNAFLGKSANDPDLDPYKARRFGLRTERSTTASPPIPSQPIPSEPIVIKPVKVLVGHQSEVLSLAFSHNGQQLASASRDQTLRLWNLDGQQINQIEGHQGQITAVQFGFDSESLFSAAADQTVRMWDVTNPLRTEYIGSNAGVVGIDIRPDGEMIAAASSDHSLYLWNRSTGKLARRLVHPDAVLSAAFSPNGQTLVTGGWDNSARLWTLKGELLETLEHIKPVWDAAFSPNGQTIATGSIDGSVRLWDLRGHEKAVLSGHSGQVRSVAFSADGQFVLSASLDDTAILWNTQGALLRTFRGQGQGFIDASFSPDGTLIATGGFNNTAEIWSVKDGELKATLVGHDAEVRSVSFSQDGRQLVTASGDGTIKLWKTQNGELIATLAENDSAVWKALFAEGDRTIISAGEDRRARLWRLDKVLNEEGLVKTGCQWVKSYLQNNPSVEMRDICHDVLQTEK